MLVIRADQYNFPLLLHVAGAMLLVATLIVAAACLVLAVILLIGPLLPSLRRKRELVALDEGA